MTLRPCLTCGLPSAGPRCPEHTTAADTKGKTAARGYKNRWTELSKRARKQQPWCTWCQATTDLTLDHIIPLSIAPELVLSIENGQVLCRCCNSKRANRFTEAEAQAVLERLQAAYERRPTKQGRERINAAQRAIQTRGQAPTGQPHDPRPRQNLRVRS